VYESVRSRYDVHKIVLSFVFFLLPNTQASPAKLNVSTVSRTYAFWVEKLKKKIEKR